MLNPYTQSRFCFLKVFVVSCVFCVQEIIYASGTKSSLKVVIFWSRKRDQKQKWVAKLVLTDSKMRLTRSCHFTQNRKDVSKALELCQILKPTQVRGKCRCFVANIRYFTKTCNVVSKKPKSRRRFKTNKKRSRIVPYNWGVMQIKIVLLSMSPWTANWAIHVSLFPTTIFDSH